MRPHRVAFLVAALLPMAARAQDTYKVEALKQPPPAELSAAIRGELNPEGYRVVDGQGKPLVELWLRKAVPVDTKPAGAQGTVQFPALRVGELLGAARYVEEGQDYRDQPIVPGAYTLRYGLQPVNGAHLGVSPFRDYALLLTAEQDTDTADLPKAPLEEKSAEAAGTSHPAVLMLLTAPSPAPAGTDLVHDEEKQTWGVVVPLALAVKGQSDPARLDVQVVVVGAAMD